MHVIRLRKPWTKTLGDGVQTFQVDVPEQTVSDSEADEVVAHYQTTTSIVPADCKTLGLTLRISGWHGRLDVAESQRDATSRQ